MDWLPFKGFLKTLFCPAGSLFWELACWERERADFLESFLIFFSATFCHNGQDYTFSPHTEPQILPTFFRLLSQFFQLPANLLQLLRSFPCFATLQIFFCFAVIWIGLPDCIAVSDRISVVLAELGLPGVGEPPWLAGRQVGQDALSSSSSYSCCCWRNSQFRLQLLMAL